MLIYDDTSTPVSIVSVCFPERGDVVEGSVGHPHSVKSEVLRRRWSPCDIDGGSIIVGGVIGFEACDPVWFWHFLIQVVHRNCTDHFEPVSLCVEVLIERENSYEIFLTIDEWYPVKFRNDGGVLVAISDHTRWAEASHRGWLIGELHAGHHEDLVECTVLCVRSVPSNRDSATVVIRCINGPHIGQRAWW